MEIDISVWVGVVIIALMCIFMALIVAFVSDLDAKVKARAETDRQAKVLRG